MIMRESCAILSTGKDMYDSGILENVLVSDRATVELVVREE